MKQNQVFTVKITEIVEDFKMQSIKISAKPKNFYFEDQKVKDLLHEL